MLFYPLKQRFRMQHWKWVKFLIRTWSHYNWFSSSVSLMLSMELSSICGNVITVTIRVLFPPQAVNPSPQLAISGCVKRTTQSDTHRWVSSLTHRYVDDSLEWWDSIGSPSECIFQPCSVSRDHHSHPSRRYSRHGRPRSHSNCAKKFDQYGLFVCSTTHQHNNMPD